MEQESLKKVYKINSDRIVTSTRSQRCDGANQARPLAKYITHILHNAHAIASLGNNHTLGTTLRLCPLK